MPKMVPSNSRPRKRNSVQDLISNLPDNIIDKILKRLSLKMVAKMSVLSRKWRQIWLSLRYLVFDENFWKEIVGSSPTPQSALTCCNRVISNILFHHVGPVHLFVVFTSYFEIEDHYLYSGWISLLSKIGVKKIFLLEMTEFVPVPSYIFDCKDLVKLRVDGYTLNCPPSHFKGFDCIKSIELVNVKFNGDDVFRSLISKCPRLGVLKLGVWSGMKDVVIDGGSLERLSINGDFESVVLKNVYNLCFLSLCLDKGNNRIGNVKREGDFIEMLASSCRLQDLQFGGQIFKYFGGGCFSMSPTLQFLHKLRLQKVDLSDFDEFCFTLGMIQCCPNIEYLSISVNVLKRGVKHEVNYDKYFELRHLVKVRITGLTGSRLELKLIEYLLSITSKLEELAFKCYKLDPISELKVARSLLELPRASVKAKLVSLGK